MTDDELFGLFDEYSEENGLCITTTRSLLSGVRGLCKWMGGADGFLAATGEDIADWMEAKHYAVATCNARVSGLSLFYRFLMERGLAPADPAKGLWRRHRAVAGEDERPYDTGRFAAAVREARDNRTDEKSYRLYAMICASVYCGLRAIEISRADIGDWIDGDAGTFLRVRGPHAGTVPVCDAAREGIGDYLERFRAGAAPDEALFLKTRAGANWNGGHFTWKTGNHDVRAYFRSKGAIGQNRNIHSMVSKILVDAGYTPADVAAFYREGKSYIAESVWSQSRPVYDMVDAVERRIESRRRVVASGRIPVGDLEAAAAAAPGDGFMAVEIDADGMARIVPDEGAAPVCTAAVPGPVLPEMPGDV